MATTGELDRRTLLRERRTPAGDIRHMRSEPGDVIIRENCPDGQFWLVFGGRWHFREDRDTRILGAFDLSYSAPGQPCRRTTEQMVDAFGVQVSHMALRAWPQARHWLDPVAEVPWASKRALLNLTRAFFSKNYDEDECADQVVLLLQSWETTKTECSTPSWLRRAKEILHESDRASQSLDAIAREIGISPAHLSTSFRAAFGVTLSTYRRRVRIERAMALAAGGWASLSVAAIDAGFYDASHLHRACLAELGLEPTQLRKVLADSKAETVYKTIGS